MAAGDKPPKEKHVGTVEHYYPKAKAAAVKLDADLKVGDTIHIQGHGDDRTQKVTSMQLDHEPIAEGHAGESIGVAVPVKVHEKAEVLKVEKAAKTAAPKAMPKKAVKAPKRAAKPKKAAKGAANKAPKRAKKAKKAKKSKRAKTSKRAKPAKRAKKAARKSAKRKSASSRRRAGKRPARRKR